MADKSIIDALNAALDIDPSNVPLRLHLASVLFESGETDDALRHSIEVLSLDPTNDKALKLAADISERMGDLAKAAAYRKILDALGGIPHVPSKRSARDTDEWAEVLEETSHERIPVSEVFAEASGELGYIEIPDLRLSDVAGMEEVKRRLELAFLSPLKNPEMMKLYGKSLRGGLLLYGAPGCGKTFIARAVAGELGARFITVGLSDILDMWTGNSEKNIHSIFEQARRNAPCVLFFDELDALGRKRSLNRHSGSGAITQLLSELDGIDQKNEGVFVLAATNHPWDVDTALRRPGRLDRTVLVLPPDEKARSAALRFHLRSRPADATVDVEQLAKMTDEYSGADIAHLVESAAEFAMADSLETGNVRSISQADLTKAMREVKPSTRSWFEMAKNYALFANDGGVYDDLIAHLRKLKMLS
jgi:SpoVK/Ycf46/Vps4 family AAA+-type ATPase